MAHAQAETDPCDAFVQSSQALMYKADITDSGVLQAIVTMSAQGRACYDGTERTDRVVWFLDREVWALHELGRYEEADALIVLFDQQYAEQAPDLFRGRMAIKKQRLRDLQGDRVGEALAFQEAHQFRHALDANARAVYLLNGVSLYRESGDWERAFELIEEARDLVEEKASQRHVYARTLVVEAETLLEREEEKESALTEASLLQARALMLEGMQLYEEEEVWERYHVAHITLGRIEARLGNVEVAFALFEEAEAGARAHEDLRTQVVVALRRGGFLREQGRLDEAEAAFTTGLALGESAGLREHELDLLMGLAQTHQDQNDLAAARRLYRQVLEAPPSGVSVADVREAQDRARQALLNTLSASETNASLWHGIGLVLFVLLVVGGFLFYRRRPAPAVSASALDALLQRTLIVPLDADDSLMNRRLAYIQQVLAHPERVLPELEDPTLRRLLRRGPEHNTDLFLCAAALEERATGRTFENDPANTLGRYLRQEFKTRHIPWPQTPEAWRRLLDIQNAGAEAMRAG